MHNIAELANPNAARLDPGGFPMPASVVFAAGFGPVPECLVPCRVNDGTESPASDRSVPDSGPENYATDNPALKLYRVPFDELRKIRHPDTVETDAYGNSFSVCDEDGYTVGR